MVSIARHGDFLISVFKTIYFHDYLQESLSGYILLLMGTYWCTEVLPLGITALIPVFLVPLFGIMTTEEVCFNYMEVKKATYLYSCTIKFVEKKILQRPH